MSLTFLFHLAPLPWILVFLSNCLLDFLLGYHISHWQVPDWAPHLIPNSICSCHTDPYPSSSSSGQKVWGHPWLHFFSHLSHSIRNKSILTLPLKYIQNLFASTPLQPPAPHHSHSRLSRTAWSTGLPGSWVRQSLWIYGFTAWSLNDTHTIYKQRFFRFSLIIFKCINNWNNFTMF